MQEGVCKEMSLQMHEMLVKFNVSYIGSSNYGYCNSVYRPVAYSKLLNKVWMLTNVAVKG